MKLNALHKNLYNINKITFVFFQCFEKRKKKAYNTHILHIQPPSLYSSKAGSNFKLIQVSWKAPWAVWTSLWQMVLTAGSFILPSASMGIWACASWRICPWLYGIDVAVCGNMTNLWLTHTAFCCTVHWTYCHTSTWSGLLYQQKPGVTVFSLTMTTAST